MNNPMWKEYSIGDIGTVIGGGTPSTKNEKYYEGDISWITPKDLSNFHERFIFRGERSISMDGYNNSSAQMLPPGSVLFSSRAPIGYIAIAGKELCTNQGFKSVIPNDKICDSMFLYYLLSYYRHDIEAIASGTTFMEVSGTAMKKFMVKIPALPIQQDIATILSSLDAKIELNTQINHNLEEQAKAIFKSWFVDFEPFQNGKFVDSELGRIPHGWKILPFTELVQIQGGGTPKTSNAEYWNGEIPFFTPKDVGNAVYTLATEKNITQDGLNNCNSPLYPVNTVFVTARGTVGKIALSGRPMAMNQSCYALVGKKNLSSYFVHHLALCAVESLKVKASGAVFDTIVTRDFDSEKLISPPEDVIMDFTNKVKPFYEQILRNELQNENLTAMRDTLLPKLMSGEIDVSEVTI